MNWKILLFVGLVGYGGFQHYYHRPIIHGAGEIAPSEPIQSSSSADNIQLNGFTLTALADYSIEARVLSREDYSTGITSELSPTDLALGWGPMSDEAVLDNIDISQRHRWFYWHADKLPIPQHEIEIHAANTHIIPADDIIRRQLSSIKVGQLVKIKGLLVEAKRADGWHWRSSLSREDVGNGACELIYVTQLSAS
ncbi:hypothetical protein MCEKH45_01782 [Methylophilaceae bacterium]|jgi:hypothetical protein